jgi:hypothetical protein
MKMQREAFGRPREKAPRLSLRPSYEEDFRSGGYKIRGDVFIELRDGATGDLQERRELKNLVVLDASILIARLMKNNVEPPFGIYVLAVGTGQVGWNPMSPPAATNTQRALWSELARKTFAMTNFVDQNGIPASYPTNVVDFTTTYAEAEAVGPLDEMGLIGGNVNPNLSIRNPVSPANGPYDPTVNLTNFETLVNYLTFPVINKPPTSTLTIVWRLTF